MPTSKAAWDSGLVAPEQISKKRRWPESPMFGAGEEGMVCVERLETELIKADCNGSADPLNRIPHFNFCCVVGPLLGLCLMPKKP